MPIYRIGRNTTPTDIQSVGDFVANPLSLDNPPNSLYNKGQKSPCIDRKRGIDMAKRLVYVMNPAAGNGRYLDDARRAAEEAGAEVHLTERSGECSDYIAEACLHDPDTHFVVYGGDGTAGEAATGIMMAGAGKRASITIVPAGSGNDFVRGIAAFDPPEGQDHIMLDMISVNGRYVLNMLNIGFDCEVAAESEDLRRKRAMNNSASYIAGVAKILAKKPTIQTGMSFHGIWQNGSEELIDEEHMEGEFLLTAVANCPYCGGGFKALPTADPTDGFMDILVVKNISRAKFLSVVGAYRAGTHFHQETRTLTHAFASIAEYRRCKAFTLDTVSRICLDGEIIPACGVRAEVIPEALRYVPQKYLEKNT